MNDYIWLFKEARKRQKYEHSLISVRNFIKNHTTHFAIISVFSLFNNALLYLFLSFFVFAGIIELSYLFKAIIVQNVVYFKHRKIK